MTAIAPARITGGLVLVLSLFAAGCNAEKPTGTVAGKVTYKGKTLAVGDVNFLSKAGAAAIARLDDAGGYKIDGELDAGEYRVYVTPPPPEPAAPGTRPTSAKKFDLPPKFRAPETSGVTVTVKSGSNDILVEFKD